MDDRKQPNIRDMGQLTIVQPRGFDVQINSKNIRDTTLALYFNTPWNKEIQQFLPKYEASGISWNFSDKKKRDGYLFHVFISLSHNVSFPKRTWLTSSLPFSWPKELLRSVLTSTEHTIYFNGEPEDKQRFIEGMKKIILQIVPEFDPSFSVVIPVYNRPRAIKRCINSVLEQTHPPKEVIVVNDGSTDETPHMLKEYGRQIKVITLSTNEGVSKARNVGIQAAKCPWIALLDSDDKWMPHKLEKEAEFIESHPYLKLFQSREVWYRNGVRVNPKKYHKQPEGWIFKQCLERCLISPSSVVIHQELFDRFGYFDETLPACEDYDFWLRLTRHLPCGLVPEKTVIKFGGHADQLSRKYPAMDRFRIRSLENLLKNESSHKYRKLIESELMRKKQSFERGAGKRR